MRVWYLPTELPPCMENRASHKHRHTFEKNLLEIKKQHKRFISTGNYLKQMHISYRCPIFSLLSTNPRLQAQYETH